MPWPLPLHRPTFVLRELRQSLFLAGSIRHQGVDEGRHVEVFHGYLTRKLNKLYEIDDNLYTVIDALMTDNRWDLKFLGMQIMIEGLALGAFSAIRNATNEPLLKEILKYVITDEARHVHYGVLALSRFYKELGDDERAERGATGDRSAIGATRSSTVMCVIRPPACTTSSSSWLRPPRAPLACAARSRLLGRNRGRRSKRPRRQTQGKPRHARRRAPTTGRQTPSDRGRGRGPLR